MRTRIFLSWCHQDKALKKALLRDLPLAEQGLGDAVRAVDGVMVGVHPERPGYPAHVPSGEGFLELLGVPEFGRHLRRGDELVPGGTLAAGALALRVVSGKACAAPAIVLLWSFRTHPSPPQC